MGKRLIHIEYHLKLDIGNIKKDVLQKWSSDFGDNSIKIEQFETIPEIIITEYCNKLSYIENSMPDEPGNDKVIIKPEDIRNENNILSFVLIKNKEILGISRVYINTKDSSNIYQAQIGIYERYRGKGLAKLLLSYSYLHFLRENEGLSSITVDTHPSNMVMISLFEHIGFEYTHTEKIYNKN